ncbi:hypothetical protein [Porphyromonas sp.]
MNEIEGTTEGKQDETEERHIPSSMEGSSERKDVTNSALQESSEEE